MRERFALEELNTRNLIGLCLEGRSPLSERSVPNSRLFVFSSQRTKSDPEA